MKSSYESNNFNVSQFHVHFADLPLYERWAGRRDGEAGLLIRLEAPGFWINFAQLFSGVHGDLVASTTPSARRLYPISMLNWQIFHASVMVGNKTCMHTKKRNETSWDFNTVTTLNVVQKITYALQRLKKQPSMLTCVEITAKPFLACHLVNQPNHITIHLGLFFSYQTCWKLGKSTFLPVII